MRNDEQLLNDETEATNTALYETAYSLYQAIGQDAVCEWGYRVGLPFARCEPCETDTPTIRENEESLCAVCATVREELK